MLNVKALLTKFLGRVGCDIASGTAGSALTRGFCTCVKDHSTNTVRLHFYFGANQNLATSTYLFTIPSGYRPTEEVSGVMMYTDASNVSGSYSCKLTTSGVITQNAGSTIRQGFGFFEYPLGGGN